MRRTPRAAQWSPIGACMLSLLLQLWPTRLSFAQSTPLRPLSGEAPTVGVRLVAPAVGTIDNATALELNPAGLAFLPAWSLSFRHSELPDEGRFSGRGSGWFAGIPLFRSLALGAAVQWLRPTFASGYEDYLKLSLGFAWRFRSSLSLAFAYHSFISDDDGALDDLDTVDLGLMIRPSAWLAFGATLRNLTGPRYYGLRLQRVYDTELVFRPLGTTALEVGGGVRIGERRGDIDPHFRLTVKPIDGLAILTNAELVRRDFARDRDKETDFRLSLALQLSLERISAGFGLFLGRRLERSDTGPLSEKDTRAPYQGVSVALDASGARSAPLFHLSKRIMHVRLEQGLDQQGMLALMRDLQRVARRRDLAGVLVEIDDLAIGWAQTQEIRAAIIALRRRGKHTIAYIRTANFRQYYLASAAETILVDPDGALRVGGIAVQSTYLRGLLDRAGVGANFVKIAEYKSAPEMFTEKGASKAAAAMRRSLLDSVYRQVLGDIARARKQRTKALRALLENGPFTPAQAQGNGLVDALIEPADLLSTVKRRTRTRLVAPTATRRKADRWLNGPVIAAIALEGDIVSGESQRVPIINRQVAGDETLVQAIRWAASNRRVRAVVLRVNSPGGSALASAHIWRALRDLKKRKPLIVSLGDVAASGGYYAACAGDHVVAQPSTLTGSIGIFTGKFDFQRLLARLDIRVESEARGKNALLEAFSRPYTSDQRRLIEQRLRYHYRRFVSAVAKGRKMKADEVDHVARGRVWTGSQATARRLVDATGGWLEAISEAKRRAGIADEKRVPVLLLPKRKRSWLQRAAGLLLRGTKAQARLLQPLMPLLNTLPPAFFRARSGEALARMPFTLHWTP